MTTLTSKLIDAPAKSPVAKPFVFPGIFRSKHTGSLWLANTSQLAVRLFLGPRAGPGGVVGDRISQVRDAGYYITPDDFEQVTEPTAVLFNA